jgi:hypothetical protein
MRRTRIRRAAVRALGALALLTLAACAREGPIPFLPSSVPKSAEPQPEYPLLFRAPRDQEQKPPVLNAEEQKAIEERLRNLGATREKAVRRRIERNQ